MILMTHWFGCRTPKLVLSHQSLPMISSYLTTFLKLIIAYILRFGSWRSHRELSASYGWWLKIKLIHGITSSGEDGMVLIGATTANAKLKQFGISLLSAPLLIRLLVDSSDFTTFHYTGHKYQWQKILRIGLRKKLTHSIYPSLSFGISGRP